MQTSAESRQPQPFDIIQDNFDSISTYSRASTVVDSEYAAEYAAAGIRKNQLEPQYGNPVELPNNQIHLNINVINNGNSFDDRKKSIRAVDVTKLKREPTFREEKSRRRDRCFRQKYSKPKILSWGAIIMIVILGILSSAFIVYIKSGYSFNLFAHKTDQETTITSIPSTSSIPSISQVTTSTKAPSLLSTSTPTTPTPTTNTEETTTEKELYKIILRADWGAFPREVPTKLKVPVERIIIMDTQTEACDGEKLCKIFVSNRQKDHSLFVSSFHDIPENFLISPDGNIFEGRGFAKEGQHSIDRASTSYNNQAIGVSFIGNYTSISLNDFQLGGFKKLVETYIAEEKIVPNYKLYYREQLVASRSTLNDKLYDTVKQWEHWKDVPKIIRRADWNATRRSGTNEIWRVQSSKVVIGHTENSTCLDLEDCMEILRQRQIVDRPRYGDIRQSFVFAGNDFIFEGRNFDVSNNLDKIELLFIGNFTTDAPPQSLVASLEAFLQYALDLGKLKTSYKLYGERQIETTSSPGDKFYEILQKPSFDAHFDFNTSVFCGIWC